MRPEANSQARRYFVSGTVQGVGYRMFAARAAAQLGIDGYVRNLRDGRVEVLALGAPEQLTALQAALRQGPRFASVESVAEEPAVWDERYADEFHIESER